MLIHTHTPCEEVFSSLWCFIETL